MNRQQRRAMGLPKEENKRVQVYIQGDVLVLKMIGLTSLVSTHAYLDHKLGFKLGWSLIRAAWKMYKIPFIPRRKS